MLTNYFCLLHLPAHHCNCSLNPIGLSEHTPYCHARKHGILIISLSFFFASIVLRCQCLCSVGDVRICVLFRNIYNKKSKHLSGWVISWAIPSSVSFDLVLFASWDNSTMVVWFTYVRLTPFVFGHSTAPAMNLRHTFVCVRKTNVPSSCWFLSPFFFFEK